MADEDKLEEAAIPKSQSSPLPSVPLPQIEALTAPALVSGEEPDRKQILLQPKEDVEADPRSHVSPRFGSTILLPQVELLIFPSLRQSKPQPAPINGGSQSSPASTRPFPHAGTGGKPKAMLLPLRTQSLVQYGLSPLVTKVLTLATKFGEAKPSELLQFQATDQGFNFWP